MKRFDWYIIKKFLSTFLFTLSLILVIVIVFDISEKIDDFLRSEVSLNQIVFQYYLNFIPYFANLFSPLFIFISVIYFTSKMASNSEIIAILNSGMSFTRLIRPFIISAIFLAIISFVFGNFIIPETNKERIDFALDHWINRTQYGFRRAKSTAQAMYVARRIQEIGEKQGTNMTLILLDWEKAFDKIDQQMMIEAIERLNVPSKLIDMLKAIYKKKTVLHTRLGGELHAEETKSRNQARVSVVALPVHLLNDGYV